MSDRAEPEPIAKDGARLRFGFDVTPVDGLGRHIGEIQLHSFKAIVSPYPDLLAESLTDQAHPENTASLGVAPDDGGPA